MFNEPIYSFKILSVLRMSWGKQYKYALPRPYHAISFRIKGKADFIHGENSAQVQENELIFVPKDYDYIIQAHQAEDVIVIHFDADLECSEIQIFAPTDAEIFISLFNEINAIWQNRAVGYKHKAYSLLHSILEAVTIQTEKSHIAHLDISEHFENALAFMRSNFSDPNLSIETLAKIANVSSVYFRKLFKRFYAISPLKYLTQLRLKRAKSLLKTGYYTVEEVATQCGFNDPKYFSTSYKRHYGKPPAKEQARLFKSI